MNLVVAGKNNAEAVYRGSLSIFAFLSLNNGVALRIKKCYTYSVWQFAQRKRWDDVLRNCSLKHFGRSI